MTDTASTTSSAPTPYPSPGASPVRHRSRWRQRLSFDRVSFIVVFLGVPLVLFLIFVISPFVQAIYYSLTDWGGFTSTMNFIGLSNYVDLAKDDIFRKAVGNNIILAVVVPLVTIVLSMILATLVTVGSTGAGTVTGMRRSGAYRVVSFFPYVIPQIVIALIWQQVYTPTGLLNSLLTAIGLDGFLNYPWLGDARTALPSTIFVIVWGGIGFYMILFIAAIRGIDPSQFEAARLDGAGRFRTAVSITIPQIRDNVQTAYIYLGIAAIDSFVFMQGLNPQGGPQNSTLVMAQQLFTTAFGKAQFGYATAMGVVMAVITLLFAAIVFVVSALLGGRDTTTGRRNRRKVAAIPPQPLTAAPAGATTNRGDLR